MTYPLGRTRILFIVPSLHIGGSERVVVHLISNLNRVRFEIILLVLNKSGNLISSIPGDIQVIYFNHSRTAFSVWSIIKTIWRVRPQIVFSTLGHLNLLIAFLRRVLPSETRYMARESSIVSIRNKDERYPRLFNFLFKTVYNRFDRIICQSEYMKADLVSNFGTDNSKITVINNPVDFRLIPLIAKSATSDRIRILSVGNIRPEKGYERVLTALEKLKDPFIYKILGGGEATKLRELVKNLSLSEKVLVNGPEQNPFPFYFEADFLLLGSYYEGFPNVVLEANACGLPVIAYRAPGGHNEIIVDGVNGWFVESGDELCKLIESRIFKKVDQERIITMTREKYDLPKIMMRYEQTLTNALE